MVPVAFRGDNRVFIGPCYVKSVVSVQNVFDVSKMSSNLRSLMYSGGGGEVGGGGAV